MSHKFLSVSWIYTKLYICCSRSIYLLYHFPFLRKWNYYCLFPKLLFAKYSSSCVFISLTDRNRFIVERIFYWREQVIKSGPNQTVTAFPLQPVQHVVLHRFANSVFLATIWSQYFAESMRKIEDSSLLFKKGSLSRRSIERTWPLCLSSFEWKLPAPNPSKPTTVVALVPRTTKHDNAANASTGWPHRTV